MRFVLNGTAMDLTAERVREALRNVVPEPVREHAVRVGGAVYPVKQAFEQASGVSRRDFTSQTARRLLVGMGLEVLGAGGAAPSAARTPPTGGATPVEVATGGSDWPWEGEVQAVFGALLSRSGWLLTALTDTASKAPGVDVLARKGERKLGAEVKGWPSKSYADPRRAGEDKPTSPTTQAGHWFSQALMKSLMLLDSHPGHESLIALPDYPRYRDLAARTRTGRAGAGVHVVLMRANSEWWSETWTP